MRGGGGARAALALVAVLVSLVGAYGEIRGQHQVGGGIVGPDIRDRAVGLEVAKDKHGPQGNKPTCMGGVGVTDTNVTRRLSAPRRLETYGREIPEG